MLEKVYKKIQEVHIMKIEQQNQILIETNKKLTKQVQRLANELNKLKKDKSKETKNVILELSDICKEWKTSIKMMNCLNENNKKELVELHNNIQGLKIAKRKLSHTLSVTATPLPKQVKNKISAFINR